MKCSMLEFHMTHSMIIEVEKSLGTYLPRKLNYKNSIQKDDAIPLSAEVTVKVDHVAEQ